MPTPNKGYYWVKFYNHHKRMIMYFNGKHFESFKSDDCPHDEIEWYTAIEIKDFNYED
jgi:hypothetical protein